MPIGLDATPMEELDPKLFDDVIGLSAKGLHASVIISLGYRILPAIVSL